MALSRSLLLIGVIACFEIASSQPKTLYFSFITAHSDQYTALGAIPAVDLALQRINSDSTILPGYMLNYTTDVGNSMVSCYSEWPGTREKVITRDFWKLLIRPFLKEVQFSEFQLYKSLSQP